jgi:hypothetical protein
MAELVNISIALLGASKDFLVGATERFSYLPGEDTTTITRHTGLLPSGYQIGIRPGHILRHCNKSDTLTLA